MKKVLLLIEDNPLLVGMYESAFKKQGVDVLFAYNGEEGVRIAQKEKPSLILLDLLMPDMDGFGVLEKLRGDDKTKDLKVAVLSVIAKQDAQARAKEFGVVDYLIKSELKLSEIVERVIRLLG